jgi:hypothetical protein
MGGRVQAEFQVFQGRRLIARQKEIIARLRVRGEDASGAEQTLKIFRRSLMYFQADLQRHVDAEASPATAEAPRIPHTGPLQWQLRRTDPPRKRSTG